MSAQPRIDILLATWNGEKYLGGQIDSILAQSYSNWRLIARDDGSSDGTLQLIERYAAEHSQRIEIIEDGRGRLGASGSFSALMEQSDAAYLMFCDQDDVWLPEKIESLMEEMRLLEEQWGREAPLLVHCDLKVVDSELNEIAPSFWRYQNLNPEKGRFLNRLLIQNVVTGCALLMNRHAKDLAMPVHKDARMHDWWLALVTATFGHIGYVSRPLQSYRQHGANTLGAKAWSVMALFRLLFTGQLFRVAREKRIILADTQKQASAFAARYGGRMDDAARSLVEAYAALPQQGVLGRRLTLVRHGFLLDGLIKKAGLFILV